MIKSRRMRLAECVAHIGQIWNRYRILIQKLEGKRPLRRHARRWKDNIKINLKERNRVGMAWRGLISL
jgi:hypothetical protein